MQTFYTCQHSVNHKAEALDHQKMSHALCQHGVRGVCSWTTLNCLPFRRHPVSSSGLKGAVVSTTDYLLHFCVPRIKRHKEGSRLVRERETCQLAISRQHCETVNHSVTTPPISHNNFFFTYCSILSNCRRESSLTECGHHTYPVFGLNKCI